jgi:hypothetical protein
MMVKKKPSGKPLDELIDEALRAKSEVTPDTGDLLFDEDYGYDYRSRFRQPVKDTEEFANRAVSLAEERAHLIKRQDELIDDLRRIVEYLNQRYGFGIYDNGQATFLRAAKALLNEGFGERYQASGLRSSYVFCAVCACELCVRRTDAEAKAIRPGVYTIPECCGHKEISGAILPF